MWLVESKEAFICVSHDPNASLWVGERSKKQISESLNLFLCVH